MKVLVTIQGLMDEDQVKYFEEKDIQILNCPTRSIEELPFDKRFSDVEVIVGGGELSSLDLSRFHNIRLIQLISSGYDYLPKQILAQSKVSIANAKGVYSIPISEWVIGQILYSYKRFYYFQAAQNDKQWAPDFRLQELNGQKVIVFGTGSIGVEIMKRLVTFGCVVDGVNSNGRPIEGFSQCFSLSESKEHIGAYDVLVFVLPSTSETKKLLNKTLLDKVSDGSLLINVGRGDLIVEDELLQCLKSKKNIHVCLDVHTFEPLPRESKLWEHPQIFVTPHTSFSSNRNKSRLRKLVVSNILSLKEDEVIINEVLKGDKK